MVPSKQAQSRSLCTAAPPAPAPPPPRAPIAPQPAGDRGAGPRGDWQAGGLADLDALLSTPSPQLAWA